MRHLLTRCGEPDIRIRLWDSQEIQVSAASPVGHIVLRQPSALWRLLADPEMGFGECYSDGTIDVEGSLSDVLHALCRPTKYRSDSGLFAKIARRLGRKRSHSVAGSRECIHHHYDIGNNFYKLWLDQQMQYSCAYYAATDMSLEEAQFAKLEHICRKLQLKTGDRVVEAGCGWGGLALHMANRYGVSVRAFNLSHEQIYYARERARTLGLAQQVEFVEDDYRNMTGEYDAFVSVGMLEHTGRESYRGLGQLIAKVLAPTGRGLIHSIGRNCPAALDRWIERRIFPGAYPPSLREMLEVFEPNGLSVLDVENLRLHYARTLEHWLQRFERASEAIAKMFNEQFVRMWRLYLAGSLVTFRIGGLQLFQVVFARDSNNDLPWTRSHLYSQSNREPRDDFDVIA